MMHMDMDEIEAMMHMDSLSIRRMGWRNYRKEEALRISKTAKRSPLYCVEKQEEATQCGGWDFIHAAHSPASATLKERPSMEDVKKGGTVMRSEGGGDGHLLMNAAFECDDKRGQMPKGIEEVSVEGGVVSFEGHVYDHTASIPGKGQEHAIPLMETFLDMSAIRLPARRDDFTRTNDNNHGHLLNNIESQFNTNHWGVPIEDDWCIYVFEVPNTLIGLVIGVKGKTVVELSCRNRVVIKMHLHTVAERRDEYRMCTVSGSRENINECMRMLRRRFPIDRFPDLNLHPILPPIMPLSPYFSAKLSPLELPKGYRFEVLVSSFLDAGQFFVQQPGSASFEALFRLNCYMYAVYSTPGGTPCLPESCEPGLLCVAPANGRWYRTLIVSLCDDDDNLIVKFVDYGGYSLVARSSLRLIRSDFMSLPFQATECRLAHVEPVHSSGVWNDDATSMFYQLMMGRQVVAFVVGYDSNDKIPFVEMFFYGDDNTVMRLDQMLLEAGLAQLSDMAGVMPVWPNPTLFDSHTQIADVSVAAML